MRLANLACVSGLVLAGCASIPTGGPPDGTYRAAEIPGDALVVDGNRIEIYLPTLQLDLNVVPYGREYTYRLEKDGGLRLSGSSNDSYFTRQDCNWRWTGSVIECSRKDESVVKFTRNSSGVALPPVTPQQQVWLAVAQRVRENDKSSARAPGALPVYFRTSFPSSRAAIAQLERQARAGFCGLSHDESNGVLRSLRWQNKDASSIGDVFDHRPEFVVPESHRRKAGQIGLSNVVFSRSGDTAYVNADIGGRSGSIVQMKLENGAWAWASECATWAPW